MKPTKQLFALMNMDNESCGLISTVLPEGEIETLWTQYQRGEGIPGDFDPEVPDDDVDFFLEHYVLPRDPDAEQVWYTEINVAI